MNMLFKAAVIIFLIFSTTITFAANPSASLVIQGSEGQFIFDKTTIDSATIVGPENTIAVKLKTSAIDKFELFTQKNMDKKVNIIFNGTIISSPIIRSSIAGEFLIAGLTKEQADEFIQSFDKR